MWCYINIGVIAASIITMTILLLVRHFDTPTNDKLIYGVVASLGLTVISAGIYYWRCRRDKDYEII